MKSLVCLLLHALRSYFRTRLGLQAENLALRHQITVLQRGRKRLLLNAADRFLWVCLSRLWVGWRSALAIFKPETVIRWHRTGFRLYWRWKSRAHGQKTRSQGKLLGRAASYAQACSRFRPFTIRDQYKNCATRLSVPNRITTSNLPEQGQNPAQPPPSIRRNRLSKNTKKKNSAARLYPTLECF